MHLEFTPQRLEELNYERYRHPLPMVQRRMEALWLKSHGLPHGQIAQLVNITENTLRDDFQLYVEGGVERLYLALPLTRRCRGIRTAVVRRQRRELFSVDDPTCATGSRRADPATGLGVYP